MDETARPAGALGQWLGELRRALRHEADADVPCDGCTACCESRQFVAIGPDEADALAHVPAALRFPAPGRPGHVLLPYDEHGRCPMLLAGRCSIYAHRPRACRTYDCRVFSATGVRPAEDKVLIRRRTDTWRFTVDGEGDRTRATALRAAAAHLEAHPALVEAARAEDPTQRAVLAVVLHDLFMDGEPPPELVGAELRRRVGGPPA